MSSKQPPWFSTYILRHVGQVDEALLGDLAEEFALGRSRWWYMWQAVSGTALSVWRSTRQHPFLLLRALVAVVVVNNLILLALAAWNVPDVLQSALWFVTSKQVLNLPGPIHVRFQLHSLLWLVSFVLVSIPGAWGVAALHATVRAPMTFVVLAIAAVGWLNSPELQRLLANMPEARFVPYLLVNIASAFAWASAIVIGGIILPVPNRASVTKR
jgi:hypothetical protein